MCDKRSGKLRASVKSRYLLRSYFLKERKKVLLQTMQGAKRAKTAIVKEEDESGIWPE